MSKIQLLSVTKNLFIVEDKRHTKLETRLLLNTVQILEQVTPKSENRKSSPCSIFGDTFTINTLQLHKYIKDYLI